MSADAVYQDFATGGAVLLMEHANPVYLPDHPFRLSFINPDQHPKSIHFCLSRLELEQLREAISAFLEKRPTRAPSPRWRCTGFNWPTLLIELLIFVFQVVLLLMLVVVHRELVHVKKLLRRVLDRL